MAWHNRRTMVSLSNKFILQLKVVNNTSNMNKQSVRLAVSANVIKTDKTFLNAPTFFLNIS